MAPLYIPDYTHCSTYHLSIYSITPIPVPPFYPLDYTNPSATLLPTRLHPFQCHLFTYSITPILFTYTITPILFTYTITPILFIYSITPIPMPPFYLLDYTHPFYLHDYTHPFYLHDYTHPFYLLDYTHSNATFLSTRLHPSFLPTRLHPSFLSTRLHPFQCHFFIYSITPIPMPLFLSTRLHPFQCHFFYLLDYTHSNATFLPTRFIVCNLVLVMNIQSIININNHYQMPKTMRKDSITIYRSMSSPN